MILHPKYQDCIDLVISDKIFSMFSFISQCKTCDPGAGPFLAPGAQFENKTC